MSLRGGSGHTNVVVLLLAALMANAGCGGAATTPPPASSCKSIERIAPVSVAAAQDGLQLPSGSGPVGLTVGQDGAIWLLATGSNRVYRITSNAKAEYWQLPASRSEERP